MRYTAAGRPCPGFLCQNGVCLAASQQCDGRKDCSGGEDEVEDGDSDDKSTWMTEEEFKSCGTSTAMRKVFKCITDAKKTSSKNTNKSKREKKTDKKQPNLLSFFKVKNE